MVVYPLDEVTENRINHHEKKLVACSVQFSTENFDDLKKYVNFLNEDYAKKHKLYISEFINLVPQKKSCPYSDSMNFKKN